MNPLPYYRMTSKGTCSVCWNEDTYLVAHEGEGNKHPVHIACVQDWIIQHKICPSCSASVDCRPVLPKRKLAEFAFKLIANDALFASATGAGTGVSLTVAGEVGRLACQCFGGQLLSAFGVGMFAASSAYHGLNKTVIVAFGLFYAGVGFGLGTAPILLSKCGIVSLPSDGETINDFVVGAITGAVVIDVLEALSATPLGLLGRVCVIAGVASCFVICQGLRSGRYTVIPKSEALAW